MAESRHTERVPIRLSPRHLALVPLLAATLALSGCFGSSPTEPTASPGLEEPAEAGNFCDAMAIATASAVTAGSALAGLYDEMANDEILSPGADLTALNAAGENVVAYGNGYLAALAQVRTFADATLYEDLDAISDYWSVYAVALGQVAADAPDYSTFVDQARPLIESTDTTDMRTAQIAATDDVNRAYATACSDQATAPA